MRISDCSSDVCSADLIAAVDGVDGIFIGPADLSASMGHLGNPKHPEVQHAIEDAIRRVRACGKAPGILTFDETQARRYMDIRSEEHTSELQSLMRISYAVFCLKKKTTKT